MLNFISDLWRIGDCLLIFKADVMRCRMQFGGDIIELKLGDKKELNWTVSGQNRTQRE